MQNSVALVNVVSVPQEMIPTKVITTATCRRVFLPVEINCRKMHDVVIKFLSE